MTLIPWETEGGKILTIAAVLLMAATTWVYSRYYND